MTRRPPDPDTPVRGRAMPVIRSLRPEGPVAETGIIDRVSFAEALVRMGSRYDDPRKAHAALMRLILSGQVPVTCRELIYTTATGSDLMRYSWPGEGAKLAQQIAAANRIGVGPSHFDPVMGDVQWLDLLGRPVATANAYGLHVDGKALAVLLALPVAERAPPKNAEPAAVALEAPKPREQTLKQFVLDCVEGGIASWTVAYHKHYKPAASEGRVVDKSRAQFEAAYKEHYPNPKSGPKSGK